MLKHEECHRSDGKNSLTLDLGHVFLHEGSDSFWINGTARVGYLEREPWKTINFIGTEIMHGKCSE